MSTFTINGVTYTGNNISVINNKVIIDGVDQTPNAKQITITIDGNVTELKVDACQTITVTGNVNNLKTQSGDVDVQGSVQGNIQTQSGDVDCGTVGGNISTMSGDVKHRKA